MNSKILLMKKRKIMIKEEIHVQVLQDFKKKKRKK